MRLQAQRAASLVGTVVLLAWSAAAHAGTVTITTDTTVISQPSYTFGDWIFELTNPSNTSFNLINSSEDFIVSNECCGKDFTLRRLDDGTFTLTSLRYAGEGTTTVGGVDLAGPGYESFVDFGFSGQPGVTNVSSVLLSPLPTDSYIQVAGFDFSEPVPEPPVVTLLGTGLGLLLMAARRHG
jgi:hypothetical protein